MKIAWLGDQKAQAWRKAYDTMRAKYTVLLPAPPEDEPTRIAAAPPATDIPAPSGEGPE